jgi:hypothetical protein
MSKLIASFTHHHNNEDARPWRAFVESEADALEAWFLARETSTTTDRRRFARFWRTGSWRWCKFFDDSD